MLGAVLILDVFWMWSTSRLHVSPAAGNLHPGAVLRAQVSVR